jgi:hypothetical protein
MFILFFRYVTIEQHLIHLQNQLEQTEKDIRRLKEMKERALASPDDLIKFLSDPHSRSAFPKLQEILSIPNLDIHRYQVRLTRRANTRFEQNLEYLSARVQEVQTRLPLMRRPSSSIDLPVSEEFKRGVGNKRPFKEIREQFLEVLGTNPGALKLAEIDSYINPNPPVTFVSTHVPTQMVHQPRPRQTPRFNTSTEDLTDLNPMDYHHSKSIPTSRSASVPPVAITPISSASNSTASTPSNTGIKIRIRKPSSQAPENTPLTHNIPWSDDEKRKLDYLLTVFPEEEIQARRYAKIAAALGTRTGNQVASRIQKIAAKAQRHKEKALRNAGTAQPASALDEGATVLVAELEAYFAKSIDPKIKETSEYVEYLKLKGQLEAIAKNPVNGVLHVGYKCDCCGTEPIIGPRWTCCSCPKDATPIDLCDSCVSKGFETDSHKSFHVMKKIEFSEETGGDVDPTDEFYL